MSKQLDEKEADQMFAAEERGYKFIKLHLNKKRIAGVQKELHIHGVKRLNAYNKGLTDDGIQQFEFERSSGTIKFKRDRKARAYVGHLWVDDYDGLYGEKSYNIDFLATHVETGDFTIVDPKWKAIVEKRYKHIRKILDERAENPVNEEVEKIDPSMDIKDIDAHMKMLAEKKALLLKNKSGKGGSTAKSQGRQASRTNKTVTKPVNTSKNEQELASV